jgi:PAS domain S-box-containing protein
MKRLYRLFVVFAIFDLLAISCAFFLAHRVARDYSDSVEASQRRIQRVASYTTLDRLAGLVDGPANTVFDDGQVETDARQMESAASMFTAALNDARCQTTTASPAQAKAILAQIDKIDRLMRIVVADGRGVFNALREGGRSEAEVDMALADRGYANVRGELARIDALVRESRERELQQQARYLALLQRYEYGVAALIALSVVATALYGRRIRHEILATDQRDQYLHELQRHEEELRQLNTAFAQKITGQERAETALRRSEERFHLAARATNDVVFEWDFKTNACWCNETMSQFGSGASGDVDLTAWSDALHPEDRDRVLAGNRAAISSGEQFWSGEYRFRKSNGAFADVLTRAFIVHSATGEPLRMIGVTMDISERKRAERAYNTQILNSAAEGIFGLDAEGDMTFVNESAARLLGWSVGELVGKDMHAISHHHHADGSEYPSQDCPARMTLRTGESGRSDQDVFWRKDGSTIPVEYATTPIRDGEGQVVGAVVTFRDVSERRAVEKMKDEFVSIVSHELRTPLTSIRGALGLLAGGRLGEIPDKGKRMLAIAVSNTDRLVHLINDILDIERIESGNITLSRQACDSYELMTQAIELIRPTADQAEVTLRCAPCDATLWADPDRLLQTLSNLLSNAVKFSPPGGVVSLSATLADANVVFEVADEGRGIPADKLEVIFERFQQVDASDSREKGGSGLGLAICRSIVRQHGGEIHAQSTLGKESRFRFTIPVAA